jgi:hypothetical protein
VSIEILPPLMLRPLRARLESKIELYYGIYFERD